MTHLTWEGQTQSLRKGNDRKRVGCTTGLKVIVHSDNSALSGILKKCDSTLLRECGFIRLKSLLILGKRMFSLMPCLLKKGF